MQLCQADWPVWGSPWKYWSTKVSSVMTMTTFCDVLIYTFTKTPLKRLKGKTPTFCTAVPADIIISITASTEIPMYADISANLYESCRALPTQPGLGLILKTPTCGDLHGPTRSISAC